MLLETSKYVLKKTKQPTQEYDYEYWYNIMI